MLIKTPMKCLETKRVKYFLESKPATVNEIFL